MPLKRCVALTKRGERCKIRGNLTEAGLCFRHSKSLQSNAVLPQKGERKTTFEKIERGVKIAGPAIGGLAGLIKVVEWVVTHWPAIEHFFTMLDGRAYRFEQLKRRLESGTVSRYEFVYAIEQWYARLPNHVRMETERQFGDMGLKMQSVRRTSL